MIISDGINHGKLQSIIVGKLKKVGLKHRLKKIICRSVKDHKTVFGAPLPKVPSCSVICCGSTLCIPMVVSEMSAVLRANSHVEGLFRKAGSQTRQKDIKRLLDAGGCVSNGHHPIDVASVLKLYLRCLPEPLINAEVQDLLIRCKLTAGESALKPLLHTLLLLPVLHVHLLHYIMELLNFIASKHKDNLMDSSNLAIVMAPSIMPLPATSSAQRLEHHVALVKIFIENSQQIGLLTDDIMTQLDDDTEVCLARRKKRRSGSFNRMLSGLRKMVSGSVNTPATVGQTGRTPVLCKSGSKRKFDTHEGLSARTKKQITKNLPQKELLTLTPMNKGFERKRLRLSLMDARSTPVINSEYSSKQNSDSSINSEDLLTSSEHLFSGHDTIDLSPEQREQYKDYVKISKQEYEEIKSRVSAIESRLSREFNDVTPSMEPLQQVQNVYEQTLEEVAMLDCPTSDHLARRLSKELKIRPSTQTKIIRSPSARKIGTIRRRSKENVTKIVRQKSCNSSSQSHVNPERFYPYEGLTRRDRISSFKTESMRVKVKNLVVNNTEAVSENLPASLNTSLKQRLRKRISLASADVSKQSTPKRHARRSLNINHSSDWNNTGSESSINITFNKRVESNECLKEQIYQNVPLSTNSKNSPQHKWRNAAAFFMEKTGELDNSDQSGRPSVNRLRRQNAGAVLAKAKMFESSSDKSSEQKDKPKDTFARKPRHSSQFQSKIQKTTAQVRSVHSHGEVSTNGAVTNNEIPVDAAPSVPRYRHHLALTKDVDSLRTTKKPSTVHKKNISPLSHYRTSETTPVLKKSLCTPRTLRTPNTVEHRKVNSNTPLKAVHISPRRRSPRQKMRIMC